MRRWRERLEEHGYDGLRDGRKGKASPRRVPLKTCEEVLQLFQERYYDLNVRHFHEKLQEEHGIELSYSWVKQARAAPETAAAAAPAGDAAAH